MEKQIFIYNPTSGNGIANNFIYNLRKFAKIENKLGEIVVLRTDKPGDATNYAEESSRYYPQSTIYSVGGDGTLNEVINGISSTPKLGIIPAGSGNDFYRVYERIEGTKKINLGVVNDRKFINIASLGVDAKMADTANRIKKSGCKMLSYPRAIVEEIIKYEPTRMTINGEKVDTTILTVCNGKYYGNGFPMNPEFDLSDDFLNVISAGKLTRRQIIVLLLKILREKHLKSSHVSFSKKQHIVVEGEQPLLCNVDGEIFEDTKFEFSIIKDGVTLTRNIPQYVKRAIMTIK